MLPCAASPLPLAPPALIPVSRTPCTSPAPIFLSPRVYPLPTPRPTTPGPVWCPPRLSRALVPGTSVSPGICHPFQGGPFGPGISPPPSPPFIFLLCPFPLCFCGVSFSISFLLLTDQILVSALLNPPGAFDSLLSPPWRRTWGQLPNPVFYCRPPCFRLPDQLLHPAWRITVLPVLESSRPPHRKPCAIFIAPGELPFPHSLLPPPFVAAPPPWKVAPLPPVL